MVLILVEDWHDVPLTSSHLLSDTFLEECNETEIASNCGFKRMTTVIFGTNYVTTTWYSVTLNVFLNLPQQNKE